MPILAGLVGLVPLAILAGLVWLAVRLIGGGERRSDPAVVVRQLAVYGLLAITAFILVGGIASLESELVSPRIDNTGLAQALSWLLIATPAFSVQAALADRRLGADGDEAGSVAWAGYLNLVLGVSLIGAIASLVPWLGAMIDPDQAVDRTDAVMSIAWLVSFGFHWWWKARRGIRGDVHLAFGSITAAWTLGAGNVGVAYLLADRMYTAITDDPITERTGPAASTLSALFAVGVCAWLWYWLGRYEHGDRTTAWWVTVVPAGALVGAVAAVGSFAYAVYLALTWLLGNPTNDAAVRHFDDLPFTLAVLLTGLASWIYHRLFVADRSVRNEPVRAYDYVMLAAALVGTAIGSILLFGAVLALGEAGANSNLAGVTLAAVSGPLWVAYALRVTAEVDRAPRDELRSPLRRSYLYGVVAVGALTLLVSSMIALQAILLDVLDSAVGTETLTDNAVAIATVVVSAIVTLAHVRFLADDRRTLSSVPPPPPSGGMAVDLVPEVPSGEDFITMTRREGSIQ